MDGGKVIETGVLRELLRCKAGCSRIIGYYGEVNSIVGVQAIDAAKHPRAVEV
jgi:hypothetical protein